MSVKIIVLLPSTQYSSLLHCSVLPLRAKICPPVVDLFYLQQAENIHNVNTYYAYNSPKHTAQFLVTIDINNQQSWR